MGMSDYKGKVLHRSTDNTNEGAVLRDTGFSRRESGAQDYSKLAT